MDMSVPSLIGVGLYTIKEASRLSGAHPSAIRRWVRGYDYSYTREKRMQPPVWRADIERIDGHISLSFLDLMEIRFIRAFRAHGVAWPVIREAALVACEIVEDNHPFTRRRFRTDGVRIFQEVKERETVKLLDLAGRAWVFHEIIEPSLFHGIEYEGDVMARWFPVSGSKAVVIDPSIAFGRPVLAREGIPTETIAAAVEANDDDFDGVSRWYDISKRAVGAAIEFERSLAA